VWGVHFSETERKKEEKENDYELKFSNSIFVPQFKKSVTWMV